MALKLLDAKPRPNNKCSIRGRIKRFSANSRRRLLRFMARVRAGKVRATFITLTFKGFPTNGQAKAALHRFFAHLTRKFPKSSVVWRMEYQKRGAIHFHILAFDLVYWPQRDLGGVWSKCTKENNSRVDIRLVRSRKGVMHYVSKYIAKVEKRVGSTSFIQAPYLHGYKKWRKGRFWGYHNKKCLPLGQKLEGILVNDKLIKKLSNAAWEIIGTETRYNSVSFHLFTERAASLWTAYIKQGGLTMDEWQNSRQLTRRENSDLAFIAEHFSERELENDYVKRPVVLSRPSVASTIQPCTKHWASRQFKTIRAPTLC